MTPSSIRAAALAAVLAAGATVLGAEEPSLEVTLEPQRFGIEDAAQLVVRVLEPAGTPSVDLGELKNLEVLTGPSTTNEFSVYNGAATRALSLTYILQAEEVGPASLGPVTVRLGGIELRSEVVAAEVVPGSVIPQRQSRRRSPFSLDPFEDIFARRQPTRAARVVLRQLVGSRNVVLGQPVMASIVLDTTAGGVDGFEWATAPSFPGWWAQRVEPPERITGEVVEVDGVRFNRFVVARNVLVPLKTGQLPVPVVEARIGFRSGSMFAPQQVVERATEGVVVEVSPRPREPEGFSGAVGDLRYSASLSPASIKYGESAVLSIELKGSGNLPMVEAPALWPACEECEAYPPEEEGSVKVDANGVHGSRTWRTTQVPRSWGEIEVEPVMLAVFDPVAGHYRQHALGPFRLLVEAPPPTPEPTRTAEEVAEPEDVGARTQVDDDPMNQNLPAWMLILGALIVGLFTGGGVAYFVARRRKGALPPRRPDQSPAERARELQLAVERWWLDARERAKGRALEGEMQELRRELEQVRFAPGRADHTETVADLEVRVRKLMRLA